MGGKMLIIKTNNTLIDILKPKKRNIVKPIIKKQEKWRIFTDKWGFTHIGYEDQLHQKIDIKVKNMQDTN